MLLWMYYNCRFKNILNLLCLFSCLTLLHIYSVFTMVLEIFQCLGWFWVKSSQLQYEDGPFLLPQCLTGERIWLYRSHFLTSLVGYLCVLLCVINSLSESAFSQWTCHILAVFILLSVEKIGVSWTFVMFSAVCGASVIFIFVCVPETRGKSLEQISKELNNRYLHSRIIRHPREYSAFIKGTIFVLNYENLNIN